MYELSISLQCISKFSTAVKYSQYVPWILVGNSETYWNKHWGYIWIMFLHGIYLSSNLLSGPAYALELPIICKLFRNIKEHKSIVHRTARGRPAQNQWYSIFANVHTKHIEEGGDKLRFVSINIVLDTAKKYTCLIQYFLKNMSFSPSLCNCMPIYLSKYLSVYLSVFLSVCISVYLTLCLYIYF